MWHQPCNIQTELQVHHLGRYSKHAIKSWSLILNHMRQECNKSACEWRIALYKSNQFKMVSMHSKKAPKAKRSTSSLRSFPNVPFEMVPMFVWLTEENWDSSQERLCSTSSFHASLCQAINSVMSLALCLVSQAPQHFRSSEKQVTCEGCFAHQCTCSVISLHCGMFMAVHPQVDPPLTHFSLGFPFHFSVGSSLNLWGWWHVWFDCHLLRQSSMVDCFHYYCQVGGWNCLPGWLSHHAWQWSPTLTGLWWQSHQYTLRGLADFCF